jgi:hypothetical protein
VSAISVLSLGANTSPDAHLEAMRIALMVPVGATVTGIIILATGFRRCAVESECPA